MILWHVCSIGGLRNYQRSGAIHAPVRAWVSLEAAQRFSLRTGRRIILRLTSRSGGWTVLPGHRGEARVRNTDLPWPECVS